MEESVKGWKERDRREWYSWCII